MRLNDFQRKLKEEYNENFLDVFRDLKLIFDKKERIRDEVINLNADRIELEENKRKSYLTLEEYNLQKNISRDKAFKIITSISEKEADEFLNARAIFQQILVICKTQPRVEEMKRLLPVHIYPNCSYQLLPSLIDVDACNQYDLVILNDAPHDEGDQTIKGLIDELIPSTKDNLYFLYFGTGKVQLEKYPYRLYSTNSVFSFHARIDEMIRYLKIMRTPTPPTS